MKHIFKPDGAWKDKDGFEYSVKSVDYRDIEGFISNGWFKSLEDAKAIQHEPIKPVLPEPKHTEDNQDDLGVDGGAYERELRDKISALGGTAGGRSSIATLEKKLAELEAAKEE